MFQPKLGISLAYLTHVLTDDWAHGIAQSRIQTLELFARHFAPETFPDNRPALRKLLNSSDIGITTIHADYGPTIDLSCPDESVRKDGVAEYRRHSIGLAVDFGIPIIVTHLSFGPIRSDDRPTRLRQARRSLEELEIPCRKAGVTMAIEVLHGTAIGNTLEEQDVLRQGLDDKVFGICLDLNHVMVRYRILPEIIRSLGSRMTTIHISDFDGVEEKHWFPGKGVIDWKGVMSALREIDYAGPFNFELMPVSDTMEQKFADYARVFDWLMTL